MHFFVYVMLAMGTCLAYYQDDYDFRNLIEREEALVDKRLTDQPGTQFVTLGPVDINNPRNKDVLVECPVCEETKDRLRKEICPIEINNKRFKICPNGTYINTVCDNRKDCYRGPGEFCSEKMAFDIYGHKCAFGHYCNTLDGKCTSLSSTNKFHWLYKSNWQYPLFVNNQLESPRDLENIYIKLPASN